ncbi:MAG: hypothetical protein ACJ8H8_04170 [Geminicoccaceae bacterium]
MESIVRLQERIAVGMERGDSLEQVERDVIAVADISNERKAALWLYAWSFMNGVAQRQAASSELLSTRGL